MYSGVRIPPEAAVSRKRILIIDDNTDVREMHAELFRSEGFDVLEAGDGPQGIEETGTHVPDLVILDRRLPRIDGLAVARRLRREPVTAAIPVICLSAYSSPDYHSQALAAGCSAALTKPCDPEELVSSVQKALSRQGPPERRT